MAIQNSFPAFKPTLLLDFAKTKRLDPRITFARTTTATYYDGDTVAKAEENLLTYSQEFDNAAWDKVNASVTANSTTAPDGTSTADSFVRSGTVESVVAVNTFSSSANTYVVSVFAKASTQNFLFIQVNINSAAAASFITFDLTTGSAGTQQNLVSSVTLTASSVSVGSGWYRCIVSYTGGSTNSQVLFGAASAANVRSGTNGGVIFLWGAQLEQRSSVTAYTATTTQPITNYIPVLLTAPAGAARFNHNPVTEESLGLLIEEQRTNLATYSADFSNAAWLKTAASITSDTIVAPDGTLTGDKLVEDTTTSNHFVVKSVAAVTGTTYVMSVFAKQAESNRYLSLTFASGTYYSGEAATFNLSTGVVETTSGTTTATITSVGNGWYRCSVTAVSKATGTPSGAERILLNNSTSSSSFSYTGNGYSGIYIWGAQLEAGAFPTSYIPTVAATVTRNADAASMTGSNFTSWFNNAEGTIYVEGSHSDDNSTFPRFYTFSDGTISNTLQLLTLQSSNTLYGEVKTAGVAQAGLSINTAYTGQLGKVILSYKVNDFASCFNQGSVITDATGTVPVLTVMRLGAAVDGTSSLNGTIKKLAYYPLRVTNAQLQALTS